MWQGQYLAEGLIILVVLISGCNTCRKNSDIPFLIGALCLSVCLLDFFCLQAGELVTSRQCLLVIWRKCSTILSLLVLTVSAVLEGAFTIKEDPKTWSAFQCEAHSARSSCCVSIFTSTTSQALGWYVQKKVFILGRLRACRS